MPERSEQIKENIDKVLSRSEFSYKNGNSDLLESIGKNIKAVIESIKEKIKEFFNMLNVPKKLPQFNNPINNNTAEGLKVAGICVLCLAVLVIVFLILRNFRNSKRVMIKDDYDLISTLKDPDLMELKAQECIKNGEYRAALRFLYLGLLLRLNQQNLIKINKSKSNRQYLLELRNSKNEIYQKTHELTNDFNRHWYGNIGLDLEGFDNIYKLYTSIISEVEK